MEERLSSKTVMQMLIRVYLKLQSADPERCSLFLMAMLILISARPDAYTSVIAIIRYFVLSFYYHEPDEE